MSRQTDVNDMNIEPDELTGIIDALANLVKSGFDGKLVRKFQIVKTRPRYENGEKLSIPLVAIYDNNFQIEEVGLGAGYSVKDSEDSKIRFSGDGKEIHFELPKQAANKAIGIEIDGSKKQYRESEDYEIGFGLDSDDDTIESGSSGRAPKLVLSFRNPPPKGSDNIIVRYLSEESGNIAKLKVECLVDIIAENDRECNSASVGVLRAFLARKSIQYLGSRGIRLIPPIKGEVFSLGSGFDHQDVAARRISCVCEKELRIRETKELGRMLRIPLRGNVISEPDRRPSP